MRKMLCGLLGHEMVCVQEVLLYPTKGGLVFHDHRCKRCRDGQPFQTKPLDPDWEAVIRAEMDEIIIPTSVLLSPEHPLAGKHE